LRHDCRVCEFLAQLLKNPSSSSSSRGLTWVTLKVAAR
jgi:hypothetical protein